MVSNLADDIPICSEKQTLPIGIIVMIFWNYNSCCLLKIIKMARIITILGKIITWWIITQNLWIKYQGAHHDKCYLIMPISHHDNFFSLMLFYNWLKELNSNNYLIHYYSSITGKLQIRYQNDQKNNTYLFMSCHAYLGHLLVR